MGLLTRTLTIRGTKESDVDSKGPHLRVQGVARLSGTLFERMGQTNVRTFPSAPLRWASLARAPYVDLAARTAKTAFSQAAYATGPLCR